jgi:hypothetical protein
MKAETHLLPAVNNCLAERAPRLFEAMGLRELLRASREETMPIDRSRIRKGMFLVLAKGKDHLVEHASGPISLE